MSQDVDPTLIAAATDQLGRPLTRRVVLSASGAAFLAACAACSAAPTAAQPTAAGTTAALTTAASLADPSSSGAGTTAPTVETSSSSANSAAAARTGTTGASTTTASTTTASTTTASTTTASTTASDTTASRTTSSTAAARSTAARSTSSAAKPTGTVIAALGDIPSGGGLVVQGPADKILLATANGTVVAHTAVCTHEQGPVGGDGVCTRHGSKFDTSTGEVLQGPATTALAAVPVTIADGLVYVT